MKFKLFVLFALFIFKGYSQEEEQINEKVIFVSPNYELQFPLGDMKTDFGINSNLGIELSLITSKNIYLSFNTSLIFGNNVNDTTILDHLMDENQNIIDENGQLADILLQERGQNINLRLGYLYPVFHQKSGILGYGSLGYHQHKINIDVKNSNVPQLSDENKNMYDRLTGGLSTSLFLGFLNISKNKGIHFYSGFEYTRAFTKNQRDYNHNSTLSDDVRNDGFFGIKFGWIVPISKRSTREFYYF